MKISVREQNRVYTVTCEAGETILEALISHDTYFSACCGGRGICGKCRIRVTEGSLPVTEADAGIFSGKELREGWRLACRAVPEKDCAITFNIQDESGFVVVDVPEKKKTESKRRENRFGIAIDIGTTTIAMCLVGKKHKEICSTYSMVNRQRRYGADVISRIQASNEGRGAELQKSIRKDLEQGIGELLKAGGVQASQVESVVLAGNTTMCHLLLGFSCEGLGVYPFTPVDVGRISRTSREIFEKTMLSCPVTLLPGISTYVGGDIVSGILSSKMAEREEISLLVDLGTNGEMAVGNKDRILVTSTAAGPAFEGGNISCGMGSVPGAICSVKITDGRAEVKTIGDRAPSGLCGTGVLEAAAELVKEELVDETGYLDEKYEEGFCLAETSEGAPVCFTRKDIREVQLAKSAVRAGMEVLLKRYGVTCEQVSQVYLAGGFGYRVDQEKAIAIGMLPEEFRGRIKAVGNSSLAGAMRCLTDAEAWELTERIVSLSQEISLSGDKTFNELYMEYMFFE